MSPMPLTPSPHPATHTPDQRVVVIDRLMIVCFLLFALFSNLSISITEIAAYTGFGLFLIRAYLTRSWKQIDLTLIVPVGLFIAACSVSVLASWDPAFSLDHMRKPLRFVVFFWVLNELGRTHPGTFFMWLAESCKWEGLRRKLERWPAQDRRLGAAAFFTGALILSCVLSALTSVGQRLISEAGTVEGLGGGIEDMLALRTTGSLADLLSFSELLLLTGLLALARYLFKRPREHWLAVALAIIVFALIIAMTRRTWVAFAVGAMFLLFFVRRIYVAVPIVLVVLVLTFGPQAFTERITSIADPQQHSNMQRIQMWKAGWDIFKDHPLTGCGLACLVVLEDRYPEHTILKQYMHLHSSPIQVAVETGLPGAAAWFAIWIGWCVALIKKWNTTGRYPENRWVFLASSAAVLGFLVSGLFENNFYDTETTNALYFIMALPFVVSRDEAESPAGPSPS